MVAKNFENGDLVWAKMKGYPPWPGKITNPPKDAKPKKTHHYVLFYDSDNYACIHDDAIEFHSETLVDKYTKGHKRPPSYLNAVQLITIASKSKSKSVKVSEKDNEESSKNQKRSSSVSKNKAMVKKISAQTNDDLEEKDDSFQGKNIGKSVKGARRVLPENERNNAIKQDAKKRGTADDSMSELTVFKRQKTEKSPQKAKKSDSMADKRQKSAEFSGTEKQTNDKSTTTAAQDDSNKMCKGFSSDEEGDEIIDFRKEDIYEIKHKDASHNKSKNDKPPVKDDTEDDETDQLSINKKHLKLSETEREIESEINTIQQQKGDEMSVADTLRNEMSPLKKNKKSVTAITDDEKVSLNNKRKGDVHVTRKQRKSLTTDDKQVDNEAIEVETQRSDEIENKKEQRKIRIGLAKTPKSKVLSLMRKQKSEREALAKKEKVHEASFAKKVKTPTSTKQFKDDVSTSSIPSLGQFLNLLVSEHSESSRPVEATEVPEIKPILYQRPESPSVDLNSENEILKLKNVTPTKKKIGFLGLGSMGQRIVKNLLQSGHSVTVWNRTMSKCDNFSGAKKALTPEEVVLSCDIIFCCVANTEASKTVFFGYYGVASGFRAAAITGERKGFVEMTTIDPEISKAMYLEVNLKGGRYLEAQLTGSKEQASEGNLLIVAAGDKSLFEDCQSCFFAIGKTSMLVSDQVGVASTFNMIHNMLYGSVYAALAESLALVDSIGLKKEVFINSFMHPKVKSVVHLDKNHTMGKYDHSFNTPVNTPLIHIQKSLNAALLLGASVAQPMHVNATANEVYKHCKLLRFQDRDISAVYEAARR